MFATGQIVAGRYRVLNELGHGGFGRVYLAQELERPVFPDLEPDTLPLTVHEPMVLRQVALKAFPGGQSLCRDLVMELRALCKLSHPHIVAVHDYQVSDPPFIVMEYVLGQDLESRLKTRGPLAVTDALTVARQIGSALAHAHTASLLHRDVKPSNVIVSEDLRAKLVDFGLARNFERLSQASTRLGTPGFVAPEILDPERFRYPVGIAADVYGFGCLLNALLTGDSPFGGSTPMETLRHQMEGHRRPSSELHPVLGAVIERATALSPADRFPSIPAILEQLRTIEGGLDSSAAARATGPRRADLLDARVLAIDPFNHPVRGQGVKFELGLPRSAEVVRGFVYEEPSHKAPMDLFQSLRCGWPGAELSLFSALSIQSREKGRFLGGDRGTVPILMPHFLVSVTDVISSLGVNAPDCPARPFVDQRQPDRQNIPRLLGALIHQVLDHLAGCGSPRPSFDEVFQPCLARKRLAAVAAGVTDSRLGSIRQEVRDSFDWLEHFIARQRQGSGQFVEVTRFSGRYGLEGRIDMALMSPEVLEIVELKSGHRQKPEHELQLRCYALLWDAFAARGGRRIQGRLIYSRAGLEKVVARLDHEQERAILRSRNEIVAAHHALARGEFHSAMPCFGQWPERCQDHPCQYRQVQCRQQCAAMGLGPAGPGGAEDPGHVASLSLELVQAARHYYRHFVRLVELEYLALSRSQGEFTRRTCLAGRLDDGSAVNEVNLDQWDPGSRAVRLQNPLLARFVPGTELVVHRGDPDDDAILIGKVETADSEGVVIRCDGSEVLSTLPRGGWIVERYLPRLGQHESSQALFSILLLRDPAYLRYILFGCERSSDRAPQADVHGRERSSGGAPRPLVFNRERSSDAAPQADVLSTEECARLRSLNASQRRAVEAAISCTGPLLIHGPPGTGKTTVIAHAVRCLVERGRRVLVTAGTNTAVDNILVHLSRAGVDFLRLGHLEPESLLARTLEPDDLRRKVALDLGLGEPSLDLIATRLMTVPVVAGTAHRCIRSDAIQAIKRLEEQPTGMDGLVVPFDVAIVDEATQIIEPLSLGAILLARRFILVGDRCQLPPVVSSDEAHSAYVRQAPDEISARMDLRGLDFTLFERLTGRAHEVTLKVQYRMNGQIQDLANQLYYSGSLDAHPQVSDRRLDLDLAALLGVPEPFRSRWDPQQPLVWETLGTPNCGHLNPEEVQEVASTVAWLFKSGAAREDLATRIGIISPFRAQCFAIRRALAEELGEGRAALIEVDTAERFQGREKEIMIVSLVVSEWSDFVMDARRLNVAFTRARSKMIVFGPALIMRRYLAAQQTGHRDGTPLPGATCDAGA